MIWSVLHSRCLFCSRTAVPRASGVFMSPALLRKRRNQGPQTTVDYQGKLTTRLNLSLVAAPNFNPDIRIPLPKPKPKGAKAKTKDAAAKDAAKDGKDAKEGSSASSKDSAHENSAAVLTKQKRPPQKKPAAAESNAASSSSSATAAAVGAES